MSRTRTVLVAIALILITVLVIVVWAVVRYTATPQYSVAELALAIETGDWQTVQVYADTDALAEDVAAVVVEQKISELPDAFEALGESVGQAAEPVLAEEGEKRMQAWVEGRSGTADARERIAVHVYVRDAKQVLVDGDSALVTIDATVQGTKRELDLRLTRAGRHWRVTQIENLEELLAGTSPE